MSTQIVMEADSLSNDTIHKFKQIQTHLQASIHEHKKSLLEVKSQLEYEKNRADEFEDKYKNAIRYQNEEKELKKIMTSLNEQLKSKQNQILELLKSEQEKKLRISDLQSNYQQLQTLYSEIQQKFGQIQEGAVSAIMEKDSVINELQAKLELVSEKQYTDTTNLNVVLMELSQKYKELEQRSETTKIQLQSLVQQKEEEIKELEQKAQHHKQKLEQRISRLQQQVHDYEKHIEHINEERIQQENLQQKYYILEQKLRKSQKRSSELELLLSDVRKQYEQYVAKYLAQQEEHKNFLEQIKSNKLKIKQLYSEIKEKEKLSYQLKVQSQKSTHQLTKKISLLENQKKKSHDLLDLKNIQIERLRVDIEDKIGELAEEKSHKIILGSSKDISEPRESLTAEITTINTETRASPAKATKKQSQQQIRLIEKYKHQICDLQESNALLNKKLLENTQQLQELRQRLVLQSGSASRSKQQTNLMCFIEDLNNHIKKLENSLLTEKYKYAEDENFWKMKEKNYKLEQENLIKQSKKEKSELLQRIDRMKKSATGKDKKMDYYQSAFK